MSRAAKQILKEKKRKRKLGVPGKKPETPEQDPKGGRMGIWILVIAALMVIAFVVTWILARSASVL